MEEKSLLVKARGRRPLAGGAAKPHLLHSPARPPLGRALRARKVRSHQRHSSTERGEAAPPPLPRSPSARPRASRAEGQIASASLLDKARRSRTSSTPPLALRSAARFARGRSDRISVTPRQSEAKPHLLHSPARPPLGR